MSRYNAAHALTGPLLLSAAGAATIAISPWVLGFGLLWLPRAVDRACGYGLRTPDGRQRG